MRWPLPCQPAARRFGRQIGFSVRTHFRTQRRKDAKSAKRFNPAVEGWMPLVGKGVIRFAESLRLCVFALKDRPDPRLESRRR
jgi:hypothetical protein